MMPCARHLPWRGSLTSPGISRRRCFSRSFRRTPAKNSSARLRATPLISPCQHGYSHRNHAPPQERAQELGLHRGAEAVLAELTEGRQYLRALFGAKLDDCLVPPWNRMDDRLIPHLATLGYDAVSRFGEPSISQQAGVSLINSTIDIIDWKAGKRGRSDADLIGKLQARLEASVDTVTTIAFSPIISIMTSRLGHFLLQCVR